MPRRLSLLLVLAALLAAACGDADDDANPVVATSIPTTTAGASTTVVANDPAPSTSTTTPASPISSTTEEPTDDSAGLPTTWFGVYDDGGTSFAVEVDTASGEIVRILATYEIGACLEGDTENCEVFEEGHAPVSVDVDDQRVAFGLCCEPVSGTTDVFDRVSGELEHTTFGSEPSLHPGGQILATAAYADGGTYLLTDLVTGDNASLEVAADWGDSMDFNGDQLAIETGRGIAIWTFDGSLDADGDVTPTVAPDDPAVAWTSPTWQMVGNLVVAQHDPLGDDDSLGVVLNTAGGFSLAQDELVIATFSYEGRVLQQGYDSTGTFLIYTLTDGSVRWQGSGRSGILQAPGSGFIAAGW